jgi:nucleotide-binding universal stress UspA family protein
MAPHRPFNPLVWRIRAVEGQTYLNRVAERLRVAGLQTQVALLEGGAANRTVEYAYDQGVDLVALSTHGQSGLSLWNVGGTVQKVIQRASSSVMLIRAHRPPAGDLAGLHYRRLLVPLDGSQRAECVLPLATTLAGGHGSELFLAHVVCRPHVPRQFPLHQEELELAERLTQRNHQEAQSYLARRALTLGLPSHRRLLVSHNVASALHDLVGREGVDLVIMSAHGFSANPRWPYGSTAVNLIAYGSSPLIVVEDLPAVRAPHVFAETGATQEEARRTLVYTADQPTPETSPARA